MMRHRHAAGSRDRTHYATSGASAVLAAATFNVATIFKHHDPDGDAWLPAGAAPSGFFVVPVGSNLLHWYCKVTAASVGARLEFVGAYDATFATSYLWAICPDVAAAAGEYSSNQTRTLVPAVGGAATNAREWRSPFPYFFMRLINGATAQGATCQLAAYVGE